MTTKLQPLRVNLGVRIKPLHFVGQPVWLKDYLLATIGRIEAGTLGAVYSLDPLTILFNVGHEGRVNHYERMRTDQLSLVAPKPCPATDCGTTTDEHSPVCMAAVAMQSPSQQGPRSDCPRGVW